MTQSDRDDFPALARARTLWDRGQTDPALEAFETALAEQPENLKALLEAARAFGGRFEIARAVELLDRATALGGEDPPVALQIAVSYARIFREHRAMDLLEHMANRSAPARAELSALYERAGRIDEALAEIDACIRAAPSAAEPRLARARLLRRQGRGADGVEMLRRLTRPGLPEALRAEAWTELCYHHDSRGAAEEAAAAIAQAHGILRARPGVADLLAMARKNNARIAAMARDFSTTTLQRWQQETAPAGPAMAHLVGFPRSGTTLLEQCLDAHPGLIASPERVVFTRDILPRLCQAGGGPLTVATLDRIPRSLVACQRARYLTYMQAALDTVLAGRVHLDKNPNHTGLLPALLRMDPAARLVIALRDPRDVVTSCVLRSFRLTEFSAMLLDWGSAAELYAAEMGAWLRYRREIDPGQWVETRYEDMVADPMGEVRRILPALGLEWDAAVTRYRDRLDGKIVNSPTQTEVRQPVHGRAVGRWRAYRRFLEPHLPVLQPFLTAFGYDD
ncbi:MAG: sulfotransferase [Pseudomonadota bacterium]